MARAIGLLSGGLDSILAVCVIREQGVDVAGLSFESPFFSSGRARESAERLGIPFRSLDITRPHLAMLKKPRHGFGSNMNPCIDCHILMVKTACDMMRKEGFDFVFTGEVLNERPMSQHRQALQIVARESGCEGYLLRPLSARLLDETVPEREGKVVRERLLDLHGRSRKPQMELAKKYGITKYLQPAGGCLLTDPGFSRRLRDFIGHEGLDDVARLALLKLGRHFRLPSGRKIIVGRNCAENEKLENLAVSGDLVLHPRRIPGPTVILGVGYDDADIKEAARLCARYSDAEAGEKVEIEWRSGGKTSTVIVSCPQPEEISLKSIS